jgi:hypothetical protein
MGGSVVLIAILHLAAVIYARWQGTKSEPTGLEHFVQRTDNYLCQKNVFT